MNNSDRPHPLRPTLRPAPAGLQRVRLRTQLSTEANGWRAHAELPCLLYDPDLWFAESPHDLERAKALCDGCPARLGCLAGAVERRETTGVWGGQILDQGKIVARKRSRGRPRKDGTPVERRPRQIGSASDAA
jgi:WhiB family redox-sensing transcriptional regulator